MIIFGIILFGLMLALGGLSFDLMRYEAHRERLQSTLDRAVLAAASLTQVGNDTSVDGIKAHAKAVVIDYLTKAGMGNAIQASDIKVYPGLNARRVEATARINVPLHHGDFAVYGTSDNGGQVLIAEAVSIAEESIGNVEIALVLDISGSMNDYGRLGHLKTAAKGFLDTVYDAAAANAVSTAIIPYSTQVNAGSALLSYFTRTDSHEFSHCLNFTASDFSTTAMSLTTPYRQTLHFDPWTDEYDGWTIGEDLDDNGARVDLPTPNCRDNDDFASSSDSKVEIMTWSTNKGDLKDYVDDLHARGNTSTDIGVKWGAAMLDPSLRTVLTGIEGTTSPMHGRPYDYGTTDALKIMVVMTDGVHTNQYYMNDYRSGDSFVWKYEEDDNVYYSVWWAGESTTWQPLMDPECSNWSGGSCTSYWDNWYVVYNTNRDSTSGYNRYQWRQTPYDGDNDEWDLAVDATRMTWDEVWAEIPPEYFSDVVLSNMSTLSSSHRNRYENAIWSVGGSTKDSRFDTICQQLKQNVNGRNKVIVYTIGLEVPDSYDARLRTCATEPGYYFDVTTLNITSAFQSIASHINMLRLTQ